MNGNYDINDLNRLEESASNLAKYNQSLTNDASSLNYIMKTINENWQNEAGADLLSVMESLKNALGTMEDDIQPMITKYVAIINEIVVETKQNQSGTIYY